MAITVTFTVGNPYNPSGGGVKLRCLVFTGAAASPVGGTKDNVGGSAYNATLTVAATGSYVVGSGISGYSTTFTAESNTTSLDTIKGTSGNDDTHLSFISAARTTSTGSATYGWSTSDSLGGVVAAEIKAASGQTLTRDTAAEPAVATSETATTVTSAPFTPPGGSVVVALCDGLGYKSGTVTDSSGMTWNAAIQSAANDGYGGVFWALAPETSVAHAAAAELSGTGTLGARGQKAVPASGALSGSGTLAPSGTVTVPGSAALSGAATLGAGASKAVPGAAPLSGSGTLGAHAVGEVNASAALSGSGTLAARASEPHPASAPLSGSGTLGAAPSLETPSAGDLSGSGTLSGGAGLSLPGAAPLSGSGTLGTTPGRTYAAGASLSGSGTLTAVPSEAVPPLSGYPDTELGARVELQLDGTWTDITQWAMPDNSQYGQITSGQPDGSQQIQPAQMSATWDNADGRFSIRNTSGPYYGNLKQNIQARVSVADPGGTHLRLEGDGPDYAYTADATALHVTGSLEARIALMLSDWGPCVLAARYGASGTPSWLWGMQDDGTLLFTWYNSSGTQKSATSTAALPYSPGATALRVTLNASTGAVAFYTSDGIDGSWAQLGSTVSGSATSVAAGNQPLTVGYSAYGGALGQVHGDVYGARLYNGIGGTVVADAAFSSQTAESASWTDTAGRTWELSGTAELSARDYRLHGELSSIAPTVATSGNRARVTATVSGAYRRVNQGQAPPKMSPMKRGLLTRPGIYAPVALWPCEPDTSSGTQMSSAIAGVPAITYNSGVPKLGASTPFGAATQALPALNSSQWHVSVPSYTSSGSIVVRALVNFSETAASGAADDTWPLLRLATTGTVAWLDFYVSTTSQSFGFQGYASDAKTVLFDSGPADYAAGGALADNEDFWVSLEIRPVNGEVQSTIVLMTPGATQAVGDTYETVSGTVGILTDIFVNPYTLAFVNTVVGMISVQSAWESMGSLYPQLEAYEGELAAPRFRRVCTEEGLGCRIIGPDASSAAMGPQQTGTVQQILADCATTDGGLIFEPRSVTGMGLRTKASMTAQPAAVTLDFGSANLPGSFSLPDDDMTLINDVTASDNNGNSVRYALDDGSAKSVSVVGDYATTVTLNVAEAAQLPGAAEWYVAQRTADAPRAAGLTADFGVPGAPAVDIARLRPGDLVVVTNVPETYQSADIREIQQGATETFGPGRSIAWDCIPSAPWDSA